MKHLISLIALCAIAVGLISSLMLGEDDSHTATLKHSEPKNLKQSLATDSTEGASSQIDIAVERAQPVTHESQRKFGNRDQLPAPNTRPFRSLKELASHISPQQADQSESFETQPLPLNGPTEQSAARQASHLSLVRPVTSFEPFVPRLPRPDQRIGADPQESQLLAEQPFVRQVTFLSPEGADNTLAIGLTKQPLIETESVLVVPSQPAVSLEDLSAQFKSQYHQIGNSIDIPSGQDEDDPAADQNDPATDEDDWNAYREEFAAEENDSDQDDSAAYEDNFTVPEDPAPIQIQASAESPAWIPNEAEQIGLIMDQISNHRITGAANEIRWSLDDAIMAALVHSNRVSSLRIESTEALQNVGVEYGEFDVAAFVEQSFRDSSEPVGNSIDTASGTQPIVQEEDFNIAYGLRRQLRSGGDFEISQSYQIRDNDSGILVPDDQAIARLNGRLTKELLRGAGRSIAMNQVLVAYHDASAQQSESVAGIADHLNEVMTAYWDIFAARGALFASIENRQMAIEVLRELNARTSIDAEPNLIAQSEATIRQRELEINQAHSDLIKAQIQFISLVNAPELLGNSNNIEILPQVTLDLENRELDIASRVNTAIQRRPEIGDIIQQITSAQATDHLSLNELLPQLSLSLEASLNGLEGDRQLGDAIGNQFENDLTYQFGLDFEVPLANRRARFTKRRTELAVARLWSDWQTLIEEVKADVLDNAQEFSATQLRLQTQREVLKFTASELRYLELRKTLAPKVNDNVSFALTQVLSAQDRQVEAKTDFIAAIADRHRAIFELNRATGILINSDVLPLDGGPGCPNCFSVYHQFIEERGVFEGPLACIESQTVAKSQCSKGRCGVGRLKLDSCSCRACETQTVDSAWEPAYGNVEEAVHFEEAIQHPGEFIHTGEAIHSEGVIHAGGAIHAGEVTQAAAELPVPVSLPRYPLQQ